MAEIITVSGVKALGQSFKKQGKRVVLVGGCFDILHPGHVIFLQKAKKAGDILVVLLESDQKVRKIKGEKRPINSQKMRALILAALKSVDYVVLLPFMETESSYAELVKKIGPDVIAATSGYDTAHHKHITQLTGARLKFVTVKIGDHSSSRILEK